MKPQGLLLVLSGPSGAGKGTICQMLREKLPDLAYSVSVTTRQARNGEVDGVNYFFKSVEEVKQMIAEGELLEYAEVYGNYYGTQAMTAAALSAIVKQNFIIISQLSHIEDLLRNSQQKTP